MRHRKIPILVHIDVEPDGLFIDPSTPLPWDGYARAHGFFAALRAQLTESSGAPAHFSWMFRMDPQIAHTYGAATWPIRQHRAYVEDHVEQGDEIGLHVHAYRWSPEHNGWTIDLGNPEWVGHCVRVAVEAYRQALGHDCQSFSFGDRWASDATFELLERLGVRFDLTVEPGRKEIPTNHPGHPYTGTLPSFVGIPQAPYHPSKTDFRVADPTRKDGIWIIPVSTGRSPYGRAADLYHRVRHPRHHTDVIKPLNLIHWPRTFLSIVNELLARLARPYLSIVLRVDAFQNARSLNHVKQNMAALQQHPRASEFIFVTQAEALHILGVGA